MAQRSITSELGGGNKPPLCNKDKFANWKIRMQAYMDAIDEDLFETILHGPYVPTKLAPTVDDPNKVAVKLKSEWTDTEKKTVQLDKKAKNILFMSLEDELFENVINCKTAKEVWDALLIMHEGTEEVRENKQSLLTQQYEMFTHVPGENITSTYERFNILLNSLRSFGKVHPNKELIIKFMRSLPNKWDAKTTAIRESKNLHEMTLQQLYGNLLTYELELNQRAETTSEGKRKDKGIALKSSQTASKIPVIEESDGESEEEVDESIALLVKKLKKFMHKNRRFRSRKSDYKNNNEELCYNCKKPGHFIAECNKPLREELRRDKKKPAPKKEFRNFKKYQKKDKGLIADKSWSDSDNDSGDESSGDEENQTANLCLMAKDTNTNRKEVSINEVFDFNTPDVDISDLRIALHDITVDLHQYMKWFRVLSKDHSLLQIEKEKIQEELNTALQSILSFSNHEEENGSLKQTIEELKQEKLTLKSKAEELEKTISAWNKSSSSMNSLITSQRPASDGTGLGFSETNSDKSVNSCIDKGSDKSIVFVKSTETNKSQTVELPTKTLVYRNHTGLGYKPVYHKPAWKHKNYQQKPKKYPQRNYHTNTGMHHIKCFTCHRYGHKSAFCYYNNTYVKPKIKQIWVLKGTNIEGPKQIWVPKIRN